MDYFSPIKKACLFGFVVIFVFALGFSLVPRTSWGFDYEEWADKGEGYADKLDGVADDVERVNKLYQAYEAGDVNSMTDLAGQVLDMEGTFNKVQEMNSKVEEARQMYQAFEAGEYEKAFGMSVYGDIAPASIKNATDRALNYKNKTEEYIEKAAMFEDNPELAAFDLTKYLFYDATKDKCRSYLDVKDDVEDNVLNVVGGAEKANRLVGRGVNALAKSGASLKYDPDEAAEKGRKAEEKATEKLGEKLEETDMGYVLDDPTLKKMENMCKDADFTWEDEQGNQRKGFKEAAKERLKQERSDYDRIRESVAEEQREMGRPESKSPMATVNERAQAQRNEEVAMAHVIREQYLNMDEGGFVDYNQSLATLAPGRGIRQNLQALLYAELMTARRQTLQLLLLETRLRQTAREATY